MFAILEMLVSVVLVGILLVGLHESSVVEPIAPTGESNPWVDSSVVNLLQFSAVISGLVGLGLMLGVVLLLMRRSRGRAILVATCSAALLLASVGIYVVISTFWEWGLTYEPLSIVILVAFALSALTSAVTLILAALGVTARWIDARQAQ